MKTTIEHTATMIVMFILVFLFTSIMTIGLQILDARLIHTSGIERLQSSYYNVSIDELNEELKEGWYFEIKELSSINTRKDYEVALNYRIEIPLFNATSFKGRIVGYAR